LTTTDGPDKPALRTFADRLNYLWETVHPPGKPNTYEQVSDGIAAAGFEISPGYLYQLRSGKKTNPTLNLIQALARYFKIPTAYFFDDDEAARIGEQLELLAAMRDAGVRKVALRTSGLTERDMSALHAMISSLREARGLPRNDPDDPGRPDD
jgi:transcriptional regulator with XRE-family HTH domain